MIQPDNVFSTIPTAWMELQKINPVCNAMLGSAKNPAHAVQGDVVCVA